MTPYVLAYIFYFIFVGIGVAEKNLRSWVLIAIVPFVCLALLRGLVGVDTPVYEQTIDIIRNADTYTFSFEPLFEFASLLLAREIENSSNVLLCFSALTTLLLFWGGYKIERQPYMLALGVVPYFYLDMTMNGIRYGLAFSIVVYGSYFLIQKKKNVFILLATTAAFIQVSSILLAILLYGLLEVRWRAILFGLFCAVVGLIFTSDYLLLKLDANTGLAAESAAAGLATLILSIFTIVTFWQDKEFRKNAKSQLVILAVLSILTFVITKFMYVGTRLQALNLFLIYLLIACIVNLNKIKLSKNTLLILFLIGVLSAGFRLKNFYNDAGQGDAPFAPYHFYWER